MEIRTSSQSVSNRSQELEEVWKTSPGDTLEFSGVKDRCPRVTSAMVRSLLEIRIPGPVQTSRVHVSGDGAQESAGESHQAAGECTEV